jgi:hypothetical protein
MSKYQNGKIYKIHSYQTDNIYIGSTTDTLSRRFSGHKYAFKNNRNNSSSEILKYDDAMITLIELYPVNLKIELHKRERYHIENHNCINKFLPTRSKQEYREKNKHIRNTYNEKYKKDRRYKEANGKYKTHVRSHFGIICKSYGIFD